MPDPLQPPAAPRGYRHVSYCFPQVCTAQWVIGPLGCRTMAASYTRARGDRRYWFIEPVKKEPTHA